MIKKIKQLIHYCYTTQYASWYAHGAVCAGVPLLVSLIGSPFGVLTYPVWVTLIVAFYVYREVRDKKDHQLKGDWMTPDKDGVTPFVDRYGDECAPVFVLLTSWIATLLAIF